MIRRAVRNLFMISQFFRWSPDRSLPRVPKRRRQGEEAKMGQFFSQHHEQCVMKQLLLATMTCPESRCVARVVLGIQWWAHVTVSNFYADHQKSMNSQGGHIANTHNLWQSKIQAVQHFFCCTDELNTSDVHCTNKLNKKEALFASVEHLDNTQAVRRGATWLMWLLSNHSLDVARVFEALHAGLPTHPAGTRKGRETMVLLSRFVWHLN